MNNLKFHPHFVFRSPALSFANNSEIGELAQQPHFQKAIYIASPALHSEMLRWLKGELKAEKEIRKLKSSLEKYASRMRSRCTPYGMFASCGTGEWAEESNFTLEQKRRPQTRLDMDFLCALIQHLERDQTLKNFLRYRANTSIYRVGDQLRYVEYQYAGEKRSHRTSSVDASDYLLELLKFSIEERTIPELVSSLVNDEISKEEATGFIHELIESQLLVSELEPSITAKDILQTTIEHLGDIQKRSASVELQQKLNILTEIDRLLSFCDSKEEDKIAGYKEIVSLVVQLGIPFEEKHLFQVDSFTNSGSHFLNSNMQGNVQEAAKLLYKMTAPFSNGDLDNFKKRYFELYEQKEMSLLAVLDTETGIGYPNKDTTGINPLVDDLRSVGHAANNAMAWNHKDAFLLQKLIEAKVSGSYQVNFEEADVKFFSSDSGQLPATLTAMFRVTDAKQNIIQLRSIGGSGGAATLLGRFAYGDEGIMKVVNDIAEYEEKKYQGKILAEIVHQPDDRVGNILIRPSFRKYEIPYLAKAAVESDFQIKPEDLFVSIRNNRIVLRSKRLNKEIVPRLSSAHNYSFNSLPLYKFLCDLQMQDVDKPVLTFGWGSLAGNFKFLPRAEYKNVILIPATWNFVKQDYAELQDSSSAGLFMQQVAQWRTKWKMPRYVVQKDGDNELLVDLESETSIRTFLGAIKKRQSIELSEFIFEPESALVKDEKGKPYTNEIIAILLNEDFKQAAVVEFESNDKFDSTQRSFIPGSEWLYYKIYCGVKTADVILATTIKSGVEELIRNQLLEKWFFIRYSDPDTHIRLRLYNSDSRKNAEVMRVVSRHFHPLIEQGVVTKVVNDTYVRELERYGSKTIGLTESLFHFDSYATLLFLSGRSGDEGEEIKWKYALKSVNELIEQFGFVSEGKLQLLDELRNNYFNEHGGHKNLKVALDGKYRKLRKDVEHALNAAQPYDAILAWRKEHMAPVVAQFLVLDKNNKSEVSIRELIASFLHMMINRIFKARQRTHEMVIYDLLYKYFKSEVARKKTISNEPIVETTGGG